MSEVFVSAESLTLVGTNLLDPAETLRFANTNFINGLELVGEPWGDDKLGFQFAKVYKPTVEQVKEGLTEITEGLRGLSFDFTSMALSYETTETNNIQ